MNFEEEINRLKQDISALRAGSIGWERFPPLADLGKYPQLIMVNDPKWVGTPGSPLTSTSFDGDSFSTTAKTLIDLSAVFGAPAGIKGVLIRIQTLDSASLATSSDWCGVSPNDTAGSLAVVSRCGGLPNNFRSDQTGPCPCNADGDIYYQCAASGANTLIIDMQIWGYWI